MTVILASQSPRRQALLQRIISEFEVIPAAINEEVMKDSTPAEYCLAMASQKAAVIAKHHPNDLVIGCDTIVTIDNEILGKPRSKADAYHMLKKLSGRTHTVYTSVVLEQAAQKVVKTVSAQVTFYPLSEEELQRYLQTDDYMDKAGAYGIQEQGALFVKGIQGDYYAIMGLPIATVYRMLPLFAKT